jgi:hypothetical protein
MTDKEFIKIMEVIAGRKLSDYEKMFCLMVKEANFINVKVNDENKKKI